MSKKTNKKQKVIAMIPARMGSARLEKKNLALLNGKPLIYYAIKAAKDSGVFDRIVLNSEDEVFLRVAKRYGVDFYKRPRTLATSQAKSDYVVYDFLKKNPCDIITWINPTSPLQTKEEIKGAVREFFRKKLDSLITVENRQVHSAYRNKPVNFKMNDIFAKTQDLMPIQLFVYSVMMWRSNSFMRAFEKKGYALFNGRVGFYPVSKKSAIIIKKKEDLMIAEYALSGANSNKEYEVKYDRLVKNVRKDRKT